MHPSNPKTLPLFLVLMVALSAVLNLVIIQAGGLKEAMWAVALMMCVPGATALAALALTRQPLARIGWRPGAPRHLALAALLPGLIVLPVYGWIWLSGQAGLDLAEWSALAQENFGFSAGPLVSLLAIFSVGLLINTTVAAGEEIGWRGFLLPELARRMSATQAALATGAIWALWHYPGLLFGGYANPNTPLWVSLVSFSVMAMGLSLVLAWLRFASNSVWPAALMHAAHNLTLQAVLDPATGDTPTADYLAGEFGLGVAAAYAVAGAVAYAALRGRAAMRPAAEYAEA